MNYNNSLEQWQNEILSLEDNQFFDTIHLYLGEARTPYNKQRLIQQLVSFLLNDENQNNILSLLDSFDLTLITVVHYISNPTKEIVAEFFSENHSLTDIYSGLANLVSRLVLYIQKDAVTKKQYYRINPLIESKLLRLLNIKYILQPTKVSKIDYDDDFCLTPNYLAAFVSFICNQGFNCKNDGKLKKNDIQRIFNVFPNKKECFELLIKAFMNLSLIKEGEKKIEIDYKRLQNFSKLTTKNQFALITVASCLYLGRENLKRYSEIFLDTMNELSLAGSTIGEIKKIAFLAYSNREKNCSFTVSNTNAISKFSKLLQDTKNLYNKDEIDYSVSGIIQMILDSAITFGFLFRKGYDEKQNIIYVKNQKFDFTSKSQKAINVDSSFTIVILPTLTFEQLLPLTQFLQITNCSITTQYAITKQSVSIAFDKGYSVNDILDLLNQNSSFPIPQSLKENIQQWYDKYESIKVYYGTVLRVTGNNIRIVESNPKISCHILQKLSEGIYLLDFPQSFDMPKFLKDNGIEQLGSIKTIPALEAENLPFPIIDEQNQLIIEDKPLISVNFANVRNLLDKLKERLAKMNLSQEVKNSLQNRINQRLIVSLDQLAITSTRVELLEASGTDYNGKLHLVEEAIKNEDSLEIIIRDPQSNSAYVTLIGVPLSTIKQTQDAVVKFKIEPSGETQNFLVSKITNVKRLRF